MSGTGTPHPPNGERVLVVPRSRLFPGGTIRGFVVGSFKDIMEVIAHYGTFRPRRAVENDASLKQIIPYLVVRHNGQLFLFQRAATGVEARLYGKFSIGVGGHINRDDVEGAADVVAAGMRRELEEELTIDGPWQARLVGILNDDENAVGQVHFGLVHIVEVERPSIMVRESDTLSGRLADPRDVRALRDRMETWSQLILDVADPMTL